MAKKPDDKTTETAPETDSQVSPAVEPEKVVTIEDQGIGANDPYPTGKPAQPEVK
jgi:hypothetical protein